tara:strand:- start:12651 stop:13211 length:561 start_codon:yes stop_codon:yes gene_type:complete
MDWYKLDIPVTTQYIDLAKKCYELEGRYGQNEDLLSPFRNLPIDIVTYKFRVMNDIEEIHPHKDRNNGQYNFDGEVIGAIQVPIENPTYAETTWWNADKDIDDGWHFYKGNAKSLFDKDPNFVPEGFTKKSTMIMDNKCALIRIDGWHSVRRLNEGRRLILSLIIDPKYTWNEITSRLMPLVEERI